jgi:6-phosphogluconolactonase
MRSALTPIGLLALALAFGPTARAAAPSLNKDTLVYVGTYTGENKGKGIYLFRLQTMNEEVSQNILLVPLGLAAETPSPSFLEIDPQRRLLFAVNEVETFQGKPTGSVSAFKIDEATGKLTLINQQPSMGTGPCHVVLDRTRRNLLVANYNSGSVAVIPVGADGRLAAPSSVIQHTGKSVHPQRQAGPHAHCVTLDPANQFAFVCDLGLDKVMAYRFDAAQGKLTAAEPAFAALKAGSGPRHMAFRPDGKFAYVLNELNSTVTAFSYDATSGKLTEMQTETTLPPYYDGKNSTAEVAVHPSGKWLYVSNRGNDTVVLFDINKDKGTLTYTEEQNTGGKTPRHFGLQPNAKHLAIGNQGSNTVLVCRVDDGNGRLKPSGVLAEVPAPACVVFLPPATTGQ